MEDRPITPEMLKEIGEKLSEIEGAEESAGAFLKLINAPDEQFDILAPGVLEAYRHTLNNPNSQLMMRQALMATGANMEEFYENYKALPEAINNMEGLSQAKKDFMIEVFGMMGNAVAESEGVAKRFIQIPIELCRENAQIPQYQNVDDGGADVYAPEDFTLAPGEQKIIKTGFKVACPPGYAILVQPRSGLSAKTKLRVTNSPGLIDTRYRDEVGVIVENNDNPIKDITYHFDGDGKIIIDSILHGSSISFTAGDRIAQLRLVEVPKMAFTQVAKINEIEGDRGGGFGSTGLK